MPLPLLLPLLPPLLQAAPAGRVRFGLRPEHIGLQPRADGRSVPVAALLGSLEHMGNEVFVHARLGDVPLTARVPVIEQD